MLSAECWVYEAGTRIDDSWVLRGYGSRLLRQAASTSAARVASWLAEAGLALKDIGQPARVALTGRTASPSLYDVLAILGRERALARLARAAATCT